VSLGNHSSKMETYPQQLVLKTDGEFIGILVVVQTNHTASTQLWDRLDQFGDSRLSAIPVLADRLEAGDGTDGAFEYEERFPILPEELRGGVIHGAVAGLRAELEAVDCNLSHHRKCDGKTGRSWLARRIGGVDVLIDHDHSIGSLKPVGKLVDVACRKVPIPCAYLLVHVLHEGCRHGEETLSQMVKISKVEKLLALVVQQRRLLEGGRSVVGGRAVAGGAVQVCHI
jgi:hypothetical protein